MIRFMIGIFLIIGSAGTAETTLSWIAPIIVALAGLALSVSTIVDGSLEKNA